MRNAVLIDQKDNVVVAIEPLEAGTEVCYVTRTGETGRLDCVETVPLYHKVARTPLPKGENVGKYGEYIGVATCDIAAGEHVHTHNCVSTDGLRAEEVGNE